MIRKHRLKISHHISPLCIRLIHSLWGWGYVGSYSMTNSDEYFANGLMTYFDVQYPYDQVDDHSRQGPYLSILDLVV